MALWLCAVFFCQKMPLEGHLEGHLGGQNRGKVYVLTIYGTPIFLQVNPNFWAVSGGIIPL